MYKHFSNRVSILLISVVFLGLATILLFFIFQGSQEDFLGPTDTFYLFDPGTILESLNRGGMAIFLPQPADFEPTLAVPEIAVEWKADNYFRIAGALHSQVYNEPLVSWKLHSVVFYTECQHIDQGAQKSVFEFYKITPSLFSRRGYEETITIEPASRSIWLKREGLHSRMIYKSSMDLAQLKVSADDAFRIAEENGGYETRMGVGNNCSVSAVLAPDGVAQNWIINYFNKDDAHLFDITIDQYTGRYEVRP